MKYKIGDRVRIQSKEWYDKHKDECGNVKGAFFDKERAKLCGTIQTIASVGYVSGSGVIIYAIEDAYEFIGEEAIEGLAEDNFESNANSISQSESDAIEKAKNYWDGIKDAWICPDDYEFKDENGNVIEAKKIVLEKKKSKYPKSYEECLKILNIPYAAMYIQQPPRFNYKLELLLDLQQLLICRDAYWEIAGKDLGLNKRWEPSYANGFCSYAIIRHTGHIRKSRPCANSVLLEFPTEEMRDAFYENFKDLIEECKELL